MSADYVDNFIEIFQTKNWRIFVYASLPFLYLFPWLVVMSVLCCLAFLIGMIVKEAAVDEKGGLGLVERHYQNRIGTKFDRDFTKELPIVEQQPVEITSELDGVLDKLIGYIVRDFINGWYSKLNISHSTEFPDAIQASLKQVFISLGKSGSEVNPTELMLAVMRQLILHVKEFREFDLTGLDIKDYLQANPNSKFHRFYTRDQVIEHLRDISMKLSIHLLPRADRNSAAVFGITREILATTVLLPVLDKITAPDFINSAVLNALREQRADGTDNNENFIEDTAVKEECLDRSAQLTNLIEQKEERINFLDSNLETVAAEDISQYLEEKLKIQGQIGELREFLGQEQDSPCVENLLDISNAVVFVEVHAEDKENRSSILGGFGFAGNSITLFDIQVTTGAGKTWTVTKSLKDIDAMYKDLVKQLPRMRNTPCPSFVGQCQSAFSAFDKKITENEQEDRAGELMMYFTFLLKDHVAPFCISLVKFFQPRADIDDKSSEMEISLTGSVNYLLKIGAGANNDMHKVLSNAGNSTLALMKKASSDKINVQAEFEQEIAEESTIEGLDFISQEDLDTILDVAFTAIEELFSLSEGDQWLRQQSLHLIKVILKRTFSNRLSRFLAAKVSAVSSQPMATETLNTLADKLWPDGQKWGSGGPPEVRSQHDVDRTTHQLYCLLSEKEGIKKSKEFDGVYSRIQTALGAENAKKGLIRGFHLIQQQQLTTGFACEVLEIIVSMITKQ